MNGSADDFRVHFAGVGAAKSGTTWLAACLSEHPQICMALGKETNYFTIDHVMKNLPVQGRYFGRSHHNDGIEWYKSRYQHREHGQLLGEYTNSYLGDPESPRLLWEHNPEMKLLLCFRNPVDAIYSAYHQISKVQPINESFDDLIEKYPEFLDYYRYYSNTLRFLDRFPSQQIMMLLFEDFRKDPGALFRQIFQFLGVDDSIRPQSLHARVNERRVIRYKWIRDLRCHIAGMLGSGRYTQKVRVGLMKLGVGHVALQLFRLNEMPGSYEPMRADTRHRLNDIFYEENEKLGRLLDRDLRHWK